MIIKEIKVYDVGRCHLPLFLVRNGNIKYRSII